MKNILIILLIAITFSCSTTKTEREARNTIDGTWLLNTVTYETTGSFEAELFNDATAQCFETSKWFFRSNNSTGFYDIIDSSCPTGERQIRWAAVETGKDTDEYDFTMKFFDEKKNDIQKNTGYRMRLKYLDANSMTMTQTVNFEGEPFKINLNFSRLTQ